MMRPSGKRGYDPAVGTTLTVIAGSPAPDTPTERVRQRLRAQARPACMLQCHRCGCREVIATVTGAEYVNGRARGGVKAWLCAGCHRMGDRVVVA